ncbi:hypothetical protein LCGC14_2118400 [marine sediment metagenome]|uniref:Uncharacterized protein n=1 Tax=marine sediment metagenome TaxID=412755 RepID=A0A0F9E515_9ZZZZ
MIFYAQKAIDKYMVMIYNISTERYVNAGLIGVLN